MEKSKISVIIPVYNGENYIKTCIESVINQTFKDFELIVINDGSTDKTESVINLIKDKRLKVISTNNLGVSSARNLGMEKANGDFILLLDSDDYIKENTLELLYGLAIKNGVDIIRYNGYIGNQNDTFNKLEFYVKDKTIIDSSITSEKSKIIDILNDPKKALRCYSPLLFFKNSNIIKFNTELKYLEDKVFYMENMLNNKKILFVDMPLYYYRFNINSKTKKNKDFTQNICDLVKSKPYIESIVKKYSYDTEVINSSYLNLILYRLDYYVKNNNYKNCKKIIIELKNKREVNEILKKSPVKLCALKNVQAFLLRNNFNYIYFLITKFKCMMKG